jgi:hypothetical protein
MTPEKFIAQWRDSPLNERADAQLYFRDLCDPLGVDHPLQYAITGSSTARARSAAATAGPTYGNAAALAGRTRSRDAT